MNGLRSAARRSCRMDAVLCIAMSTIVVSTPRITTLQRATAAALQQLLMGQAPSSNSSNASASLLSAYCLSTAPVANPEYAVDLSDERVNIAAHGVQCRRNQCAWPIETREVPLAAIL